MRSEGEWESWLSFFARGVSETAAGAVQTAQKVAGTFAGDREKIQTLGKPAGSALRVHQALTQSPVLTAPKAVELTGFTFPTVLTSIKHLQELKIVRELTGKQRDRIFAYQAYIKTLSEGTEPFK